MRIRMGHALALAAAVISGFAVYTNSYGVHAFGSATVYTTAKNLVAAAILAAALAVAGRRAARDGFTRPRGPAQWAALPPSAAVSRSSCSSKA
jgi:hypothetical protein